MNCGECVKVLTPTIIVFNLFYQRDKSLLLGIKCVFIQQDLQMFGLKLNQVKSSQMYYHIISVQDSGYVIDGTLLYIYIDVLIQW